MKLDTIREVETPEGVTLHLRLAGVMVRGYAWAMDFLFRLAGLWAFAILAGLLGDFGQGLILIVAFCLYWLYPIIFEVWRHGQTPGKQLFGIRVVNGSGAPVSWLAAIIRNLLRVVDMFPFMYGFGIASMLLDRNYRRLGDIVASTIVVYESSEVSGRVPKADPIASPAPLWAEEQAAIQAFAERVNNLTEERRDELADIVESLTGMRGEAGVKRLVEHANWIIGRK